MALALVTTPLFSASEQASTIRYWSVPGRIEVSAPPPVAQAGPWHVRLTADASRWLWAYQKAVGATALSPTVVARGASDTAAWERWVQARVDRDRWRAQQAADRANSAVTGRPTVPDAVKEPPDPGPIPADLLAAAGNPPPLAGIRAPLLYTVRFDDGEVYSYTDQVNMRPRYAYFRNESGVMDVGYRLAGDRDEARQRRERAALSDVFRSAGISESERRVMEAVSGLEGGFDAVNTYDTGSISIGFIQFISGAEGRGSLADVMGCEKREDPAAFEADFRRFGLDVDASGEMAVLDPDTGAELRGADAVRRVIADKRLTAVFQRAGRRTPFRSAQVRIARSRYWPADDPIEVVVGGERTSIRAGDVIRSEAGLATLYDRKVNRGAIGPLGDVVSRVLAAHGVASLASPADYEREIIEALTYRRNFLKAPGLSQPR